MNTTRPRIVILGGGYAGTMAANRLGALTSAGDNTAEVVLVNPRPHFVHRIRLHQWITGTGTAAHEFSEVLGDGVRLVVDTATRIDPAAGRVELASGSTLPYDHLVYAVGSTAHPVDPVPGGLEYGFPIADWEAAQRLRDHLGAVAPHDPTTVVGGGLTGLETAAELAEAGRSVRLVCRGEVAPTFGERGRRSVRRRLDKLGVELVEGHHVRSVGPDTVTIVGANGELALASSTTILAAGFSVPELAAASGLRTDPIGRLLTDDTLTSVDDPRIVGAGDAVAPSGSAFRMSCAAANQLGPHAADTVRAHLTGTDPTPVVVSFFGQCTSLGRHGCALQPTRPDDSSVDWVIAGRTAAAIKEVICRGVIWGLRREARRPGSTPALPGRPRTVSEAVEGEVRR